MMSFKRGQFDTYSREQLKQQVELLQRQLKLEQERSAALMKDFKLLKETALKERPSTAIQEAIVGKQDGRLVEGTTFALNTKSLKAGTSTLNRRINEAAAAEYDIGPFSMFKHPSARRAANQLAEDHPEAVPVLLGIPLDQLEDYFYKYVSYDNREAFYGEGQLEDDNYYLFILDLLHRDGLLGDDDYERLRRL